MKKINIFNRNINSPSYRRRPVSRGFNRGGGIPLFSGMTAVIFALFIATPSFAEPTELDKKTVASKAYVDTKQDIIETGLVEFNGNSELMLPAITTYDSTSGLVANKIGILDMQTIWDDEGNLYLYSYANGYGAEMDNFVPTVRAVTNDLEAIWDSMPYWTALGWFNTQSTAINAYNTTFGTGTNQWAGDSSHLINGQFLANSLALKQNKIPTNRITWYEGSNDPEDEDPYIYVPALVVTNSEGTALNGNTIGIAKSGQTGTFASSNYTNERYDNFVPTVRAVSAGLNTKQTKLPAAWTSATSTSQTASKGGQTIDLGTTAGTVNRRYITAGGSDGLTTRTGAPSIINYVNGTVNWGTTPSNALIPDTSHFLNGTFGSAGGSAKKYVEQALVSLQLLRDVYIELDSKITNNSLPTGTAGTVVTYNGTNAQTGVQEFTETAISGTATYDDNDQLTNGNNIANVSLVETEIATRQKKRTCAGYEPGHENEADYCWLWNFPD